MNGLSEQSKVELCRQLAAVNELFEGDHRIDDNDVLPLLLSWRILRHIAELAGVDPDHEQHRHLLLPITVEHPLTDQLI